MIYFGQNGCPYCKLLMQTTFTRRASSTRRSALWSRLRSTCGEIASDLGRRQEDDREGIGPRTGVQFTPTLLFLNEKSEVIVRLNGYQPPHRMDATLDYVSQRLETKRSYPEYMDKAAQEPAKAELNEQPFFLKPPYRLQRTPASKPLLVLIERTHCASCDELHRDAFTRPRSCGCCARSMWCDCSRAMGAR